MNKAIIYLSAITLLLFGVLVFAAVDTRDGTAIQDTTNLDGFTSNLDDADGQVIKASGGGSITEVGTHDETGNNSADEVNWSVTIDASATFIVLSISGYAGSANQINGGEDSAPRLCSVSGCGSGDVQSFTVSNDCDAGSELQQAVIYTLASPNTGSQFVNYNLGSSGTTVEGLNFYLVEYENVASVNATSYCDYNPAASITTTTVDAGNVIWCVGDTYTGNSMTWSNATEQDTNTYNSNVGEWAVNTGGSDVTISLSDVDASYTVLACIDLEN